MKKTNQHTTYATSDFDPHLSGNWSYRRAISLLRFRNTHEWCRGHTKAFVAELQEVPTTLISWLHRYMVKGHAVAVHDSNKLSSSARILQAEFLR